MLVIIALSVVKVIFDPAPVPCAESIACINAVLICVLNLNSLSLALQARLVLPRLVSVAPSIDIIFLAILSFNVSLAGLNPFTASKSSTSPSCIPPSVGLSVYVLLNTTLLSATSYVQLVTVVPNSSLVLTLGTITSLTLTVRLDTSLASVMYGVKLNATSVKSPDAITCCVLVIRAF